MVNTDPAIEAPAPAMSDDVVQRARQALDGTTPGPWKWNIHEDELQTTICAVLSGIHYNDGTAGVYVAECDASFIAAAPQLVADLAAEVEKLRARPVDLSAQLLSEVAGWESVADDRADTIDRIEAERDRLRATIDRVRDVLSKPRACGHHRVARIEDVHVALDGEAQR